MYRRLRDVSPDELGALSLIHPFNGAAEADGFWDYEVPMIDGDHVTDDAGTGFVHTAPSHGQEDYDAFVARGWMDRMTHNVGEESEFLPHVPLFASPEFHGKSRAGRYGDVVEELDWSVGEILTHLQGSGLADNTLVVFTSDNGPWTVMHDEGGSAGPLRDGKGSTWEGGMRVPAIAWWPGKIEPGRTPIVASTMDLFTTSLALGGVGLVVRGTVHREPREPLRALSPQGYAIMAAVASWSGWRQPSRDS